MATDLDAIRLQFKEIEPALEELCEALEQWLKDAVKSLGLLEARVSGRVKTVHSFLAKSLYKDSIGEPYDDPMTDTSDKVGVRVDVVYTEDVERVVEHIKGATGVFESFNVDDKNDLLLPDRLGYLGVHVDVTPTSLPENLAKDRAVCEIQVRTNAQSAWAMAVHPLHHKPPVTLPEQYQRSLLRLTALLELFDEGTQRARDRMRSTEGYPLAIVENILQASRTRFTAVPFQRDLTRQILTLLAIVPEDAQGAHDLAERIGKFVDTNEAKLTSIYAQHLEAADPVLLAQPEAILIFYLFDTEKYPLPDKWDKIDLPFRYLEELANVWGARLPAAS